MHTIESFILNALNAMTGRLSGVHESQTLRYVVPDLGCGVRSQQQLASFVVA